VPFKLLAWRADVFMLHCVCLAVWLQGIPSHQLLSELAASSDPDAVMRAAIVVRPAAQQLLPALGASNSCSTTCSCGSSRDTYYLCWLLL
jgi:hypothetical protein